MTNLYPPQIDTWMPSFVYTESCKIYFSISQYNDFDNVQGVQLTVVDPNTNKNKLDTSAYPLSIKQYTKAQINIDDTKSGSDKYYITLSPDDLSGSFICDAYYKVQLRLINTEADLVTDSSLTYAWLSNNANNLSEWSTVCLLHPISDFTLKVSSFSASDEDDEGWMNPPFVQFIASATFDNELETEYLYSYRLYVYELSYTDTGTVSTLYIDSDDQSIDVNTLTINYAFQKDLKFSTDYQIILVVNTNNGYEKTFSWKIKLKDYAELSSEDDLANCTLSAELDEDNARILVTFAADSTKKFLNKGTYSIRRLCSKDNFEEAYDVKIFTIENDSVSSYLWADYTIENGMWYVYNLSKYSSDGTRTSMISTFSEMFATTEYGDDDYTPTGSPILATFAGDFLVNKDLQINIKFNSKISQMKDNLGNVKVETIGSKYPWIRNNSKLHYRQFSISGLISSFWARNANLDIYDVLATDSLGLKTPIGSSIINSTSWEKSTTYRQSGTSKLTKTDLGYDTFPELENNSILNLLSDENIYTNNNQNKYIDIFFSNYYSQNSTSKNIKYSIYDDYIFEKYFRDKIIDYLSDNNVKLFKSASMGNKLIKLFDISFTPEDKLGDRLYNFSATAYEIDEATLYNYDLYGIQPIEGEEQETSSDYVLEQLSDTTFEANVDLFSTIKSNIKDNTVQSTKYDIVNKIISMNIEINTEESSPYYIVIDNGTPRLPDSSDDTSTSTFVLGYLIYINNTPFIINQSGILSLEDDQNEYDLTSVYFAKDTVATITYSAEVEREDNLSVTLQADTYNEVAGQVEDYLTTEDFSLLNYLNDKYEFQFDEELHSIASIDWLSISAPYGTSIEIIECPIKNEKFVDEESQSIKFTMNSTENFTFDIDNTDTIGLKDIIIKCPNSSDGINISCSYIVNVLTTKFTTKE